MFFLYPFFYWLGSENLMARTLKASADKLASETNKLGMVLAIFGIAIGGIYFVLGKSDAAGKMTSIILGALIISLSSPIMSFIKGLA